MRPVRRYRPITIKREPTRTPIWTTEEYGRGEYPREYVEDELLDMAKERTLDAMDVTSYDCVLYRRKKVGRQCSCLANPEATEPNMECPVCWGTGIVGGWEKEGCVTEVFDVTYPNKEKQHVLVHPHHQPNFFQGSALGNGWVVFTYTVPDALEVEKVLIYGQDVEVLLKDKNAPDSEYQPLNLETANALLRGGVREWNIKAKFTENSQLLGIYVRTVVAKVTYKVEMSQRTKQLSSGEFMLPDLFDGVQAALDPRAPKDLSVHDFFETVINGERLRFKPIDLTPYEPSGKLLGYEMTIRPITELEVQSKIP